MIETKPIELDDGYVLMNTEMLLDYLAAGHTIELPHVEISDEVLAYFSDEDRLLYEIVCNGAEIESVEYEGDEEVQCIEVDDEDHLYLTDGFIPTHNTSNIVFLKSTDDSMLDTLQKMSGTRHQTYTDQKMITRDIEKIWLRNEGKASYTMSTKEEPVISYNDMAFISERNSIVFRAGDSPIWNRNETILPMSWRLFQNKIKQPGKEYTLQTIPTLSSALDFDIRRNQPNFGHMLEKRIMQAIRVAQAQKDFQDAFGYSDYEIEQLDPDVYSDTIMDIVNGRITIEAQADAPQQPAQMPKRPGQQQAEQRPPSSAPKTLDDLIEAKTFNRAEKNEEQIAINQQYQHQQQVSDKKKFAGNRIAPSDLIDPHTGLVNRSWVTTIADIYGHIRPYLLSDTRHFRAKGQNLYALDGMTPYILKANESENLQMINTAKDEIKSRVYSDMDINEEDINAMGTWFVHDNFIRYLAECERWDFADGKFEEKMRVAVS